MNRRIVSAPFHGGLSMRRNSALIAGLILAVSVGSFLWGYSLYSSSFSDFEVDSRSVTGVIVGRYPSDFWNINLFSIQLIPLNKIVQLHFSVAYYNTGNYSVAVSLPYRVQTVHDISAYPESENWVCRNAPSGSVVMVTINARNVSTEGWTFQELSAELRVNATIADRMFGNYRVNVPFGGSFTVDVQQEWDSLLPGTFVVPLSPQPNCSLSIHTPASAIIIDKTHRIVRRDPSQDAQQWLQFEINDGSPFSVEYSVPEEQSQREQNIFISGILIGVLPAGLLSILGIMAEEGADREKITDIGEGSVASASEQSMNQETMEEPEISEEHRTRENNMKVERFDNAFLFALGSTGLVISLLQVVMKDLNAVVEAIPFLLLGIVFPFYIGFLRGAIEVDSNEERLRGWIYFLIGTSYYFGSFVLSSIRSQNLQISYANGQILFYATIVLGLFTTDRILKWSKRVFSTNSSSAQYAFSGTGLCAVSVAFLFSIVLGYIHDFYAKDIFAMIVQGSPEPLFWLSIIGASVCVVLIAEKASRDALQTQLELQRFRGISGRLMNFAVVRAVFLGSTLLEYALDFNLRARLLWLGAFVFWVLGCLFWVEKILLLPQVFFFITILTLSMAAVFFLRTRRITFEGIEGRFPIKTGYMALVFAALVEMTLRSEFAQGAISIVVLTIIFLFLQWPKPR
jgi:hypothetical protein